jgi:hypothetical protein
MHAVNKPSRFFLNGAPSQCALPGCDKTFRDDPPKGTGGSCFHGFDDRYYCCAEHGMIACRSRQERPQRMMRRIA